MGVRRWVRANLVLVALSLGSVVAAFLVRHTLVPLGTGNADEGAYAYLASLLRDGQVSLPAATHDPFFRPWLTGNLDGRIFFQYEPGWPAALAVADVFGSMWLAAALSAGALVLAVHAFTVELLGDRRVALLAAGVVAASPIVLLHSALTLAYLFTTLLAVLVLLTGLRAARTRSARLWVICGALLGLMLLTRPLDGVIAGSAMVAGVALLRRPVRPSDAVRGAAWLALGFVPWLVLALLFNRRTTGSLTEFPLMASDPRNTFGFGDRGMQVGTSGIHYDLHEARKALQTNLQAGIGWVFGGAIAIALATVALCAKPRLPRLWLLGLFALPPAAYFFWWATSLSANGAMNGIGPHYYVMSLVPVAVLAADGFTRVARRHLALGVAVAVLAVGATAWNLPDKIDTARIPTDVYEPLHETLDVALDDAVVFVASEDVARFTNLRYPFLRNPPGLDGPVLYAADRHAENASLIDRSGRTGYLAHREISPGDDIFSAHWVLTPLSLSQGPEVHLRPVVTLPDDGDATPHRFFVQDGDRRVRSTPISADGPTVDVVLTALAPGEPSPRPGTGPVRLRPGAHDIRIGLEDPDTGEKWMRLYRTLVDEDGTVHVIRPGTGEHVVDLGKGPVTVEEDVTNVVADGGG